MRQLFPAPADVPIEAVYANLRLPSARPDRPSIVINMVSTVDGKVAVGGRTRGIGSRTDRLLMRRIRAAADGVMVAAGTLRAERVDPRVPADLADVRELAGQPRQPLAITISRRLDVPDDHPFFVGGPAGTIVLTTDAAPEDRVAHLRTRAHVIRFGADAVNVPAALRVLRAELGVERLLVEGGPSLNQRLLDLGAIDELFWTIAPKVAGGTAPSLIESAAPSLGIRAVLGLLSLFEHDGELYARYRVER